MTLRHIYLLWCREKVDAMSVFQVSRKGSRDVADHMAIQMDDSDSITVSEQSEPSAECWQNMYKLLNFYSLISDPTGILEKSSPENCLTGGDLALAWHFELLVVLTQSYSQLLHFLFCTVLHLMACL